MTNRHMLECCLKSEASPNPGMACLYMSLSSDNGAAITNIHSGCTLMQPLLSDGGTTGETTGHVRGYWGEVQITMGIGNRLGQVPVPRSDRAACLAAWLKRSARMCYPPSNRLDLQKQGRRTILFKVAWDQSMQQLWKKNSTPPYPYLPPTPSHSDGYLCPDPCASQIIWQQKKPDWPLNFHSSKWIISPRNTAKEYLIWPIY